MQVSAIVYNDSDQGEGWRVSWNDFGYCCSVSHLCERDLTAIKQKSGSQPYFPEHVDEQKMFGTIEEAYAFFHHRAEQWRRTGADQLFSRIDPTKYPQVERSAFSVALQPNAQTGV